jgi:hypothetical protein
MSGLATPTASPGQKECKYLNLVSQEAFNYLTKSEECWVISWYLPIQHPQQVAVLIQAHFFKLNRTHLFLSLQQAQKLPLS